MLAPSEPTNLRALIGRTFNHADMKKACVAFKAGKPSNIATAALITPPIRQELKLIAQTFVDLQEARHEADYDVLASLSKTNVATKIDEVERSFRGLMRIRGEPNTNVFLAALLLQEKWRPR